MEQALQLASSTENALRQTRADLRALSTKETDPVRRGRLIRMSEVLGLLPAARDVELHDGLMQELRELTAALASG